jgi:hypothetical protein
VRKLLRAMNVRYAFNNILPLRIGEVVREEGLPSDGTSHRQCNSR